ncbi:MAG TPA: SLATT domain-containing protein, partial [Nannocystis sp.]
MANATSKPGRASKNIERVEFPELTWKSDGDVANGLTSLYKHAEARAESTIAWYLRAKASKSFNSRALRLLTILLGTLGGLAPILD